MATKLTTQTVYSAIYSSSQNTWYESDFYLIRIFGFGDGVLAFYDPDGPHIYQFEDIEIAIPKT